MEAKFKSIDRTSTSSSLHPRARSTSWSLRDHLFGALLALIASTLLILINPARFQVRQDAPARAQLLEGGTSPQSDIYCFWRDGKAIAYGLNPYSRIHGSDMRTNQKYSTLLPGFLLLASATVLAGFNSFYEFLPLWMSAQVVFIVGLGLLLFYRWKRFSSLAPALLVANLWIFNRWTLLVAQEGQIDILAALLAVLSIYCHKSRPTYSLLLFGLSLAVKQVAIFLLPIYLALAWDSRVSIQTNFRNTAKTLGLIATIPAALSLPFIIWDCSGFFMSILFSATRSAADHFRTPGIGRLLELQGLTARLPMAGLFILCYSAALQRRMSLAVAASLCVMIFIGFNPVLFRQYMVWGIALALPALEEAVRAYRREA